MKLTLTKRWRKKQEFFVFDMIVIINIFISVSISFFTDFYFSLLLGLEEQLLGIVVAEELPELSEQKVPPVSNHDGGKDVSHQFSTPLFFFSFCRCAPYIRLSF